MKQLELTDEEFAVLVNLLDVAMKTSPVGGLLLKIQVALSVKTEEPHGDHPDTP